MSIITIVVIEVVKVVRLVTTVVIIDTWQGIALRKAATLAGLVATDVSIAERKGALLENALILPQLDKRKEE